MSEPPKRLPGVELSIFAATRGGVVGKAEWASRLAELYVESAYGKAALDRQLPLVVTDEGDCWLIEGSAKPAPMQLGTAGF